MGEHSSIEWTEATWNPDHRMRPSVAWMRPLLAQALAKRLKAMGVAEVPTRR